SSDLVFGTTGSGKTSLFLAPMLQLMDRGRGFIVCTTKHDPTTPRALAGAALQRPQLWRLRVFDPAHPVHVYNPTATTNPRALASPYFSPLPPVDPASVLQGLDVGRFAALLSQPFSEVDLLQACRRGLWVYMGLPAAMDADGGQLGRLFLTDLIMAIDEIQRTEGELVHAPFVIVLD